MSNKTIAQQLTDSELDNAALAGKITFYRSIIRQLEKVLGYDGNCETIIDAAKRVVSERDDLYLKSTHLEEEIVKHQMCFKAQNDIVEDLTKRLKDKSEELQLALGKLDQQEGFSPNIGTF